MSACQNTTKPLEQPQGVEFETTLLENFTKIPILSKAWAFGDNSNKFLFQLSQRNLPGDSQRSILASATTPPVQLDPSIVLWHPCPNGDKTFVARKGDASSSTHGTSTMLLEVWAQSQMLFEISVPASVHGSVICDGWWSTGASWSPDGRYIAYVADAPSPVQTPEWGGCGNGSVADKEAAGPRKWRGVGEWTSDWGERNAERRQPSIYVLDCETERVVAVENLPEDSSCGQPIWSPDGAQLLYVAWPHKSVNFEGYPQRLGIVYCFNRPCGIYSTTWPQQSMPIMLTPDIPSAFSPRFSPDGGTLVFLSTQAAVRTGVHSATSSIFAAPYAPNASLQGCSPVVDEFYSTPHIPGIYCTMLLEQPFLSNTKIVLTSQVRSKTAILSVDIASGEVQVMMTKQDDIHSYTALAVTKSGGMSVLFSKSSPSLPFALGEMDVGDGSVADVPLPLSYPEQVKNSFDSLTTDIVSVLTEDGFDCEAIVVRQKNSSDLPCVLSPHGGPHAAYSTSYLMSSTYLAALGYCVVLVNYRGSTGFGEQHLQSLPGKIGTNDVADCMGALKVVVDRGWVDEGRVAVIGGSHGGFLAAHLVGQHPDAFKTAILRNPVCDLTAMIHLTDIPDWCFVESGLGMAKAVPKPALEDVARLAEVSPSRYLGNVRAPLLFHLGAKDRRVPPDDGKRYAEALRARMDDGPEVRMVLFPEDNHALDRAKTEFEQWITTVWWMRRHGC